jgi:predicted dehydrogenase
MDRVRIGVVGLGYWGPNLARNFHALPDAELVWCCDETRAARERACTLLPGVQATGRLDDLLEDPSLDAVVIATPVPTHAQLAVRALRAGKHCLVEKPLATHAADAERAIAEAVRVDRLLMVGHLLEYHPGVAKLKQLAASGELGDIRCIYSNRLNLGRLRRDENALWSLGAHDVSVLLYVLDEEPSEVFARGECYLRDSVEDVVFCFLRFPSGISAHLHLSWLDPHKERRLTIVGSRRMATFDDMAIEGKVTIYDKGFDEDASTDNSYVSRSGGIFSPQISNAEPLRIECEHFLASIRRGTVPYSDGNSGLRVVRVLERLNSDLIRSRREQGRSLAGASFAMGREGFDSGAGVLAADLQRFVTVAGS